MKARNNLTLLIQGDTDILSINDTNVPISDAEYKSDQNILHEVGAPETNIHYWVDSIYNDCISQISKFEETILTDFTV